MEQLAKGDKIIINEPLDRGEYPGWIKDMDKFNGTECTVSDVYGDGIYIKESVFSFHIKWCTKVPNKPAMSELEKWQLINACETVEDLQQAIITIADLETKQIRGRRRYWDAEKLSNYVPVVVKNGISYATVLTREYGIRQQALYIRCCEENEKGCIINIKIS